AQGAAVVAKPLWFLAVYVIVVAAAPPMLALHRRFGLRVPVALAVAAVAVDVARIGFDVPLVGWLNFAFVWLLPHQLGFFYADGSLVAAGRRIAAMLAAGGVAAVALLVGSGIYSPSMVGVADGRVSNNSPPGVALAALSLWLVGLVMLARPHLVSWLGRRRVWTAVIGGGSMAMTVFLWHLTALMILAPVALPLGFPQPEAGTASWWLTRPLWIAMLALVTAPLVLVFARFERPKRRAASPEPAAPRVLAAAALLVPALAGFATYGFTGVTDAGWLRPPMSAAAFAGALWLLRRREQPGAGVC
ncbi:MAG TPA: acyltransferase family protein, partial [Actinomycetota bacterium]|nr:acyltransferase family protein [Actinomycetota bacterium]